MNKYYITQIALIVTFVLTIVLLYTTPNITPEKLATECVKPILTDIDVLSDDELYETYDSCINSYMINGDVFVESAHRLRETYPVGVPYANPKTDRFGFVTEVTYSMVNGGRIDITYDVQGRQYPNTLVPPFLLIPFGLLLLFTVSFEWYISKQKQIKRSVSIVVSEPWTRILKHGALYSLIITISSEIAVLSTLSVSILILMVLGYELFVVSTSDSVTLKLYHSIHSPTVEQIATTNNISISNYKRREYNTSVRSYVTISKEDVSRMELRMQDHGLVRGDGLFSYLYAYSLVFLLFPWMLVLAVRLI